MKTRAQRRQAGALDSRIAALRRAVDIARDRLEPDLVDETRAVLERGNQRLGLGQDTTVVALAGSTGAGKSSLFNALAGEEVAPVGVLRPTTSSAQAAVWGDATEILDWLGVARRHQIDDGAPDGLVLLDLPDHDSTHIEHRLEVDRLVELVDVFVWVVDPQKYADALLHDLYLRPLATHSAVSMVVLNQIDRLSEADRRQCVADLTRLLDRDGLGSVKVISTSAATGEGLPGLKEAIRARVAEEKAAGERLSADLDRVAGRLAAFCGAGAAGLDRRTVDRLMEALAGAAGVDVVVKALVDAHSREAGLAMGWPFTRWLRRFRPDPLTRLHLGRGGEGGRTSLPAPTALQAARVDNAIRAAAGEGAGKLPDPWPASVRSRAAAGQEGLLEELDGAVSRADLGEATRPAWWSVAAALQVILATVALLGFTWLGLLFGLEWLQIPRPPTPDVEGIPWPTLGLTGGLLAGFLLSFLFLGLARLGARRRGRKAREQLNREVAEVAKRRVVGPIEEELGAYGEFCKAVEDLRGPK